MDGKGSGMNPKGAFVRGISTCRSWIGTPEHPAEPNRYHVYLGFNCPWCHRVLLARSVLGLADSVTMDVCFPSRRDEPDAKGREGVWQFAPDGITTRNGRLTTFPEVT
jgi:putative glutathione S-transferase